MSLASYADLQTQVANWLARSDLTVYIPDMITLFEAAAARKLKVRPQQTTITLTPTAGVATLPSGYLGYSRVTWTGQPRTDLTYVAPTTMELDYPTQPSGVPSVFTIEGANLRVMPLDSTGLEFVYFQRTAAVSSSLNWLWTNHPDAYLFGTLAEANFFNRGSALTMAAAWLKRRDDVFDEIQKLDFNERQGLAAAVMGPTP